MFRVEPRLEPGAGTLSSLSSAWTLALGHADAALAAGHVPVATGEPGSGRSTLLAQALRRRYPRHRILAAAPPAAQDMEAWLGLWRPELGKPHTAVLVRDVDVLPLGLADRLRDLVAAVRQSARDVPFAVTAAGYDAVPGPLGGLVDAVVAVPPLRERGEDVVPLALHAAQRARGRDIGITAAAERRCADTGGRGAGQSDYRVPGRQVAGTPGRGSRRTSPACLGTLRTSRAFRLRRHPPRGWQRQRDPQKISGALPGTLRRSGS